MTILDLLGGLDIKSRTGPLDIEIRGIAYDSRSVKNDFLFVAVRGFSKDGHDYINDAISRGAVAVVTEEAAGREITGQKDFTHIVTSDSRKALAVLSASFYQNPSDSLSLIGITGTNGKTTTGYITKSILEAWGRNTGLMGTISYIIGSRTVKALHTTPESLDLQRYLREMIDNDVEYSVIEVSSHALTLNRIDGCSFRVAAFTNFSQDHLDFHGSMSEYFSAKSRLFSYIRSGGTAVINHDDPMLRSLAEKLECDVITCGFGEGAMIRAENVRDCRMQNTECRGLSFDVQTPEEIFRVESQLMGRFNACNVLLSIGIAYALGIESESIQRGVKEAEPVPGRFERIDEGQKFLCFVDYAHTEDALKKLIKEIRQVTDRKLITVFGCGGDRDRTKRQVMGAVASDLSDIVIITSDNPRTEEPMGIIREILQGMEKNNYSVQPDRAEAIREAVAGAEQGDTLLIAGKGHEDYQEIQGVHHRFSDQEVLKKAIRDLEKNQPQKINGSKG